MKLDQIVHSDPEIMSGEPVFVGTRVPVRNLLDYLEGGDSLEDFLENFPLGLARTNGRLSGRGWPGTSRSHCVKRVLFDENMPRMLRRDLLEFEVRTVQEEGWSSLQNGALLRNAESNFDVLVTLDKRLQHQHEHLIQQSQ